MTGPGNDIIETMLGEADWVTNGADPDRVVGAIRRLRRAQTQQDADTAYDATLDAIGQQFPTG